MAGKSVQVGTASWTDRSLVDCGQFYPAAAKTPEARLRYYASQFPMVEVDSSYYALPSARNAAAWAERTPAEFSFNVKSFRIFTGHQTPLKALPKDVLDALGQVEKSNIYYKDLPLELREALWTRFKSGIEPLREAGKLCAVHFQFAPWVTRSIQWMGHIDEIRERMHGYLISAEFRNHSWFDDANAAATLKFERDLQLVHVIVDEPQGFSNSIPAVWEVTNPKLSILRLHGRNVQMWNAKGLQASSERFNYDYSKAELADLAQRFSAIRDQVEISQAIFNNNYQDQGQRNARVMISLLKP